MMPGFVSGSISSMASLPSTASTRLSLSAVDLGAKLSTLAPTLSLALVIRGGAAAGDAVMKNYYGDALGYFGGLRVPATFLAGSSLAAIFTLKHKASNLASNKEESDLSRIEKRVLKFYHLMSVSAFALSLNTIATCTVAYTAVIHGRFDPFAETAYLFMKREFLYEFTMVRWSFLSSVFCFLGMLASRLLIEFELLKPTGDVKSSRPDVAMLVVFSIGALVTSLLSYVNQNLWCWESLVGMSITVGKMVLKRAFIERRPLQIVSVLCMIVSTYYLGKLIICDVKDGIEGKL